MTDDAPPPRCRAATWMHNRLCVCDLAPGHRGQHQMIWPNQVEWVWTDRQLLTIYPKDTP